MRIAIITTDNREPERCYSEMSPRFCTGHEGLLQGFALLREVEVHVLSCTQKPMRSPEKLADNIWFHSLHVPKMGWLRTFYQGCIRAVRRKTREVCPDIVHGHGTERECAISAVLSGFPSLVTIHGNMAAQSRMIKARVGSYTWLAARLENFALRRSIGVFCNSNYTESEVRSRARKTWLVPHALRLSFFDRLPNDTQRPCILLSAGVVCPRKRQLELLHVAAEIHRQGLKCEFRFIGFIPPKSSYAAAFLERISPMEALGFARFAGAVPEGRLVECYDSVAGVVHIPTEEAFGNVVVEALARNLKFFGTRLGGIKDIAGDAPAAELFNSGDWTGLTASIARWINQGHPRPSNAAALIQNRYHPEVIARRHLEIYREVLNTTA